MIKTGLPKIDFFRTWYFEGAELVGEYRMPKLSPTRSIPRNVISLSEISSVKDRQNCWVDHFVDDFKFNSAWNNLDLKLPVYRQFEGVIGFDWSLDEAFQPGMNIWHCTKSRNADYYLQQNGIDVIPVASWVGRDSFRWCLDGLPERSNIAVSTNGCKSSLDSLRIFLDGVEVVQDCLRPSSLIVCGVPLKELSRYDNVIYYENYSKRRRRRSTGGR